MNSLLPRQFFEVKYEDNCPKVIRRQKWRGYETISYIFSPPNIFEGWSVAYYLPVYLTEYSRKTRIIAYLISDFYLRNLAGIFINDIGSFSLFDSSFYFDVIISFRLSFTIESK